MYRPFFVSFPNNFSSGRTLSRCEVLIFCASYDIMDLSVGIYRKKARGGETVNILHMKYAVEVARMGSLNRAAEVLLIAQPNLSRSIKELEADLGITIFHRSTKGMTLTPEGEEFVRAAQGILAQIEQVEQQYRPGNVEKQRFSITVPHAAYMAEAFAEFVQTLDAGSVDFLYREGDARAAIDAVIGGECKLGVVRHAERDSRYFKAMLEEKGLGYEMVAQFPVCYVFHREHPLAELDAIPAEAAAPYLEITPPDATLPAADRRITVAERAAQLELLAAAAGAYLRTPPLPAALLDRYHLVSRPDSSGTLQYRDVLIYREGYRLSPLDLRFITALCDARRKL